MKANKIIEGAIKLLTEGEWCQGTSAIDAEGGWTEPYAKDCHARCAIGALRGVLEPNLSLAGGQTTTALNAIVMAIKELHPNFQPFGIEETNIIVAFNDECAESEEDVIKVFERAIEILNEREACLHSVRV